jgi:hypothetical protein
MPPPPGWPSGGSPFGAGPQPVPGDTGRSGGSPPIGSTMSATAVGGGSSGEVSLGGGSPGSSVGGELISGSGPDCVGGGGATKGGSSGEVEPPKIHPRRSTTSCGNDSSMSLKALRSSSRTSRGWGKPIEGTVVPASTEIWGDVAELALAAVGGCACGCGSEPTGEGPMLVGSGPGGATSEAPVSSGGWPGGEDESSGEGGDSVEGPGLPAEGKVSEGPPRAGSTGGGGVS